jgi:hypothetical protein
MLGATNTSGSPKPWPGASAAVKPRRDPAAPERRATNSSADTPCSTSPHPKYTNTGRPPINTRTDTTSTPR